jgi:hypothetical protein
MFKSKNINKNDIIFHNLNIKNLYLENEDEDEDEDI